MTKHEKAKIRIGVFFGGRSGEHEVSLRSARSVMEALDPGKYDIVPVAIAKDGRWLAGDLAAAAPGDLIAAGRSTRNVTLLPEPADAVLLAVDAAGENLELSNLSALAELDVVFPVLHGPYGEDGTVQGLLELAGIPYVGAGVVGSAVAMDKAIFKQVMLAAGIPVLPWVLCTRGQWKREPEKVIAAVESALEDERIGIHIPGPNLDPEGYATLFPMILLVTRPAVAPVDDQALVGLRIEEKCL